MKEILNSQNDYNPIDKIDFVYINSSDEEDNSNLIDCKFFSYI